MNFFLPDSNNGFYRATRFDWSGNTSKLEYNGHSYYGKWYDKYEPTIHDVVTGPVEEYGPVGFSEVKTGERFIKIGVGALTKPDDYKEPTGPNYQIVFPYEVSGECRGTGETIRFEGNNIKLLRNLAKGESNYCGNINGIEKNSDNYNITVENARTGDGVRITSREPLSKMVFWASPTTVCPEPYTDIKVEPGSRLSWSINYEYYLTTK